MSSLIPSADTDATQDKSCIYKLLLQDLLAPQKVWLTSRNLLVSSLGAQNKHIPVDHLLESGKETL